jgi:hypothetical protein
MTMHPNWMFLIQHSANIYVAPLGSEIFHTSVMWLEYGEFSSSPLETNIVLFSKKDNPESMKDLRPISLCNVLYKTIYKVLVNRMKSVLSKCIYS